MPDFHTDGEDAHLSDEIRRRELSAGLPGLWIGTFREMEFWQ
jgi:hypothetical protein